MLGDATLVLNALGAIFAFVAGAAVRAVLVNWGRQHHFHSVYALPLLLESLLMFPFGLMGALTLTWHTPFAKPLTVLLLSFIMGLQNAVASKTSGGSIRTTHMTGNITDLGSELGKMFYWKGRQQDVSPALVPTNVRHDLLRMQTAAGLIGMFVIGGVVGALGFKYFGFICVMPLAALLLLLSVPRLRRDLPRSEVLLLGSVRCVGAGALDHLQTAQRGTLTRHQGDQP